MFTRIGYTSAFLAALGMTSAQAEEPFRWPNGARAAVSLAWDDTAPTQLDNAIPALNRHGHELASTRCSTNAPAARRTEPGYSRTPI